MSNYCLNGHWEDGMKSPCRQCVMEENAALKEQVKLLRDALREVRDWANIEKAPLRKQEVASIDKVLAATEPKE